MTNNGWGKEWPSTSPDWPKLDAYANKMAEARAKDPQAIHNYNLNDPIPDAPQMDVLLPKTPWITPKKAYDNKMPTHDPYTNPNSHIYYECKCGAILDPGTKSFASLNNAASNAGWKVRWGSTAYEPYCVECGEDVE